MTTYDWQDMHEYMARTKYTYNFTWLGFKILQMPQDIITMQQIIYEVKPDLIIDIGVAHGGTTVLFASILKLINSCGKVVGIEQKILSEVRQEIKAWDDRGMITLIEGLSTSSEVLKKVYKLAQDKRVLINLDSNHEHYNVLTELMLYAPLVAIGSYMIVNDTGIENLPSYVSVNRPWGKGNNPKTAIDQFLKGNNCFIRDEEIDKRLIISGHPGGYLKRI